MGELTRQSAPWWRRPVLRVGVCCICAAILAAVLPWPWWLVIPAAAGGVAGAVFTQLDMREDDVDE